MIRWDNSVKETNYYSRIIYEHKQGKKSLSTLNEEEEKKRN